jgi:hypothetical protein
MMTMKSFMKANDQLSDKWINKREKGFWNSFLGKFQCYCPVYRGVPLKVSDFSMSRSCFTTTAGSGT